LIQIKIRRRCAGARATNTWCRCPATPRTRAASLRRGVLPPDGCEPCRDRRLMCRCARSRTRCSSSDAAASARSV